jgi:hypothetical protein
MEEITGDRYEEIRNWPRPGDVLKRIVRPRGHMVTANAPNDAPYIRVTRF